MHFMWKKAFMNCRIPPSDTAFFFILRSGKQPSLGLNISTAPREFVRQAIIFSCKFSNVSRLRKIDISTQFGWFIKNKVFLCLFDRIKFFSKDFFKISPLILQKNGQNFFFNLSVFFLSGHGFFRNWLKIFTKCIGKFKGQSDWLTGQRKLNSGGLKSTPISIMLSGEKKLCAINGQPLLYAIFNNFFGED